jgi:uncharacterized membrane protein required for colicin V production
VIVLVVMGLFRGFSGALAFSVGVVAAAAVAVFGWPATEQLLEAEWARGAVTLAAMLLAFGLVRITVKKVVNGLLAQPSDALFGMTVGLAAGVVLLAAWAYSGLFVESSVLATFAARFIAE